MGLYQLGKDAKGHPLTENCFYIHTQTREVIQLFRDAAGFRVAYGPGGKHANIFNLKEGSNYQPMTQEDFEVAIRDSERRKSWLEKGLATISQSTTEKSAVQQTSGDTKGSIFSDCHFDI